MSREDMIEAFTRMIDRSFEAGWEEGYKRGLSENGKE